MKEIYSGEKKNHGQVIDCWDLYVGCKVDIFGKTTILKQCDLKTAEWNQFYGSFLTEMKNTFIEELKKYERKALDAKLIRSCSSKGQCTTNLRDLMAQVTALKERMAQYRPLLSDDIIVAFESLLWSSGTNANQNSLKMSRHNHLVCLISFYLFIFCCWNIYGFNTVSETF